MVCCLVIFELIGEQDHCSSSPNALTASFYYHHSQPHNVRTCWSWKSTDSSMPKCLEISPMLSALAFLDEENAYENSHMATKNMKYILAGKQLRAVV